MTKKDELEIMLYILYLTLLDDGVHPLDAYTWVYTNE